MKTNSVKRLNGGFTLVEIMIVVAIIGLLAAIAIPNFVKARDAAQASACISNLKQLNGMAQMWQMEKRTNTFPQLTDETFIGPSGYIRVEPKCPAGGVYTVGTTNITCSKSAPNDGLHVYPYWLGDLT